MVRIGDNPQHHYGIWGATDGIHASWWKGFLFVSCDDTQINMLLVYTKQTRLVSSRLLTIHIHVHYQRRYLSRGAAPRGLPKFANSHKTWA